MRLVIYKVEWERMEETVLFLSFEFRILLMIYKFIIKIRY